MSFMLHPATRGLVTLAVTFFILFNVSNGVVKASLLRPPLQVVTQAAQMDKDSGVKISPQVLEDMRLLPAGEMLTVIVTLNDQVSINKLTALPPGVNRATRLKNVITQLQSKADVSQRALKNLLNNRHIEGRVGQVEYLWIFNGLAVTATPDVIYELAARPEVESINANATILAPPTPARDKFGILADPEINLQNINIPAMWDMGFTGQGIVVANLDTGVDIAHHSDLASRWRGGTNSWFDPYGQHATPDDVHGHGTWTMGIMVGGEKNNVAYGVAPNAQWIAAKIFNDSGNATILAIHQAFEWVLDPDGDPNTPDAPHVVNNSWTWVEGCNLQFQTAVQNLRAAGILPVFAAGNNPSISHSPANYPEAFAVGAVDNSDRIYIDSSRGPSACDTTIYPEIVAPGVNIYTTDLSGFYYRVTGTSFASPHVAGTLALLLNASPEMTVDEQEASLLYGVVDLGSPGPDNTFGNGRLDVLASLELLGEFDISVTQTVNSPLVIIDKPLQYTISIANVGPNEATEVTLTNTHTSGVTVGSISTSRGSCSKLGATDVICSIDEIPDSSAVTVTMTVTPTTGGITLTNKSVVSTAETDYNTKNNSVVVDIPVFAEAPFKVFLPLVLK